MIKHVARNRILTDKERKNLSILEVIRKNGPISRTDISRMTEFNIVTVSNYVNHYIKKGLVLEGDLDESTGGRKPVLVELNPKAAYVIGIGLNMFSMVGLVVDLGTNVIYEIKKERFPQNSEEMISSMVELTKELIEKSGVEKDKLVGIGIGVPGIIDETGKTIRWPGAVGSKDVSVCLSIKDTFEHEFALPTFVENDANAAVLGERWLGFEEEIKNMVYMFSGVGCGIIIDGNVYRGAAGVAGELGIHNVKKQSDDLMKVNSSQLGRWAMDLNMAEMIIERVKNGEDTCLKELAEQGPNQLSLKTIIKAVKQNDSLATAVVEEAGQNLGRKIAFLVNLLNPEVIIIGGGIEKCGATLIDEVKSVLKDWAVEEALEGVKIIPSAFGENAIALGVVGIVVREIFTQA